MDIKGRNMGTWDNMHNVNEGHAELGRDKINDCESELTTNHYNRIFQKIKEIIKKIFKKK